MDTYEKKYKDLEAKIKKAHLFAQTDSTKAVLEDILPGLAESEDERIRKRIKGLIYHNDALLDKDELLAWLEKQKEPKELPLMDGNADLYFDEWNQQQQNPTKRQCFEEGMQYAQRLQKEQKPVQSAEEKAFVRTIKSIIADFIRDKKPEDVGFYQQIYDWLDGRHIEQKPVDKNKVGNLYPKEYPATPDECIKPAEWSEEDEHRRKDAIYFLESAMKHYADTSEIEKTIDWLKSIRPAQDCSADFPKHLEGYISGRADAENKLLEMYGILLMPDGELQMKPRWKPTEEQIGALRRAINKRKVDVADSVRLSIIYDNLNKL